jgi:hypothetical protein
MPIKRATAFDDEGNGQVYYQKSLFVHVFLCFVGKRGAPMK